MVNTNLNDKKETIKYDILKIEEYQEKGTLELQELQKEMQDMIFAFMTKYKEYMRCRIEEGEYGRIKLVPTYRVRFGE